MLSVFITVFASGTVSRIPLTSGVGVVVGGAAEPAGNGRIGQPAAASVATAATTVAATLVVPIHTLRGAGRRMAQPVAIIKAPCAGSNTSWPSTGADN